MRMVRRSEIIEDVQFQFLMHNGMLMRTQVGVVVCFLCFLSSVDFLTFVSYLEREEFKFVSMSHSQCFFITGRMGGTVGLGAVVFAAAAAAYLPARWG